MDLVNKIYYINLAHRVARDEEFLNEMKLLNVPDYKINRIEAVYHPEFGAYGCCCSHIYALETFIKSGDKYAIIFEDDFKLTSEPQIFEKYLTMVLKNNINFDIILLEGIINESSDTKFSFLKRVLSSCGTGGYLIKDTFAPKLLQNFQECKILFESRNDWDQSIYNPEICIDINWQKLQKSSIFYVTEPVLGCQRQGYSDIQKRVVESEQYS